MPTGTSTLAPQCWCPCTEYLHDMQLFVTGAGGYIGGHVVKQAVAAGHQVTGLVRSEEHAQRVRDLGATACVGDLRQVSKIAEEARRADAVVRSQALKLLGSMRDASIQACDTHSLATQLHLAFLHDFSNFDKAIEQDLALVDTVNNALISTNKAFVAASTACVGDRLSPWTEADVIEDPATERVQVEQAILKVPLQNPALTVFDC